MLKDLLRVQAGMLLEEKSHGNFELIGVRHQATQFSLLLVQSFSVTLDVLHHS
jgi:hypothetical protein